ERSKSFGGENERNRIEPGWPAIGKVTARASHPSARRAELSWCSEDLAVRKVRETAVVIDMEMREHDAFHIPRADAERAQLRADFLLPLDSKRHLPAMVGMERCGTVEQMCPLPGIHDDYAFGMLDRPRICRKPVAPVAVGEHAQAPPQPASTTFDLRGLDPDRAGLDGADVHTLLAIDRMTSGRSK